jgi:hypothetical protein
LIEVGRLQEPECRSKEEARSERTNDMKENKNMYRGNRMKKNEKLFPFLGFFVAGHFEEARGKGKGKGEIPKQSGTGRSNRNREIKQGLTPLIVTGEEFLRETIHQSFSSCSASSNAPGLCSLSCSEKPISPHLFRL